MKIKRKAPKPSRTQPPLYILGYSFTAPSMDDLMGWYNLEYGGPLVIREDSTSPGSLHAAHGSWSARIHMPVPHEEAQGMKEGLAWEHGELAKITPSSTTPSNITDTILFSARLARGLTSLSQGTALDVTTQGYLNPSDWQDHSLAYFVVRDHVTVTHGDGHAAGRDDHHEWVYTLGLNKFGLDELEIFHPKGLPSTDAMEILIEAADEILRAGKSPKVGAQVRLSLLGRSVDVVRHRTAAPAGRMVGFRELRA